MQVHVHAPGAGKTHAVIKDLIRIQQKDKRPAIVAVPTLKLLQQIKDDILSAGGNAVAEYEMKTKAIEHHNLIQVCTHAFLKRRCKSPLPKGSVVVVDECHQLYPHELRIADNDLWDALVANSALRSFVNIESVAAVLPQQAPPKKVKLSELQKQKQQNMNAPDRRKRFGR